MPPRSPSICGADLKYSDGSPLTAENFRYAVERTCDPVTAGEYQSILFEIVGCAEFAGLDFDEEGERSRIHPGGARGGHDRPSASRRSTT